MSKYYLFFITLLLFSSSAFGQIKGGIKAGVNLADIIITDGKDYFGETAFTNRTSYHFGSYVQNNFSEHFGFQIEMLFSNKGCNYESDSLKGNISLNYLNWPLLLEYQLGNKIDFNAGVEIGFLVAGEDVYRGFDLGIDVGVEYDLSKKLVAGLRYSQGLPFKMNIRSYDLQGKEPSYQNSVIQFYLGFNLMNETVSAGSND